jgi:hypothetical protein
MRTDAREEILSLHHLKLVPNTLMLGQYRLGQSLYTGNSSVVWQALDESTDTTVAIKLHASNLAWKTEVKFLRMFKHPVRCITCP